MPFGACFFCSYLTNVSGQWRDEDFSASQFTKAIKGRSFNGYGTVPVSGVPRRLDQSNAHEAVAWFADWAARTVRTVLGRGTLALVPVPNSNVVVNTAVTGNTVNLARQIAARLDGDARVADVLRWVVQMQPSSSGGPREPGFLYEQLRVTGTVPAGARVVLVDDVCTKQGHLRASAARLKNDAGVNVSLAVVAARTVLELPDNAFVRPPEQIAEYEPYDDEDLFL